LVAALTGLGATEAERAEAWAALLAALPTADPLHVGYLAEALTALGATEAERAEARATVLAALHAADPWRIGQLVEALTAPGATDAERAEARAALLAALPRDGDLVAPLRSVSPVQSWLAWLANNE
jgi:pyruvoyl-dependent arginine decarboxylase (PvlArgDC)